MAEFPRVFRARQRFERPRVEGVAAEVERQLSSLGLGERVRSGQRVAVAAGSRGIVDLARILRAIVKHIEGLGAVPFIVPAMGSHGGATAEGQSGVLASYGVTSESMGCAIESSVETIQVGRAPSGFPVHFDMRAAEADHVLVCNRVKPHTGFFGEIESGLVKMLLIGLGKPAGARAYHAAIQDLSFARIIEEALPLVLRSCSVLAGLAVIENGHEEIAELAALTGANILEGEKPLLKRARQLLPGLPFDEADLLIVDEMGKNISGTGMDTNVVGRRFNDHKAGAEERPRVKRIFVRELSEASHGNALGIGIADFCTRALVARIDEEITRVNAMTSGHLSAARLPFAYDSDREALGAALSTVAAAPERARVVWIRSTRELCEVVCSEAYLDALGSREDLERLDEPRALAFDAQGNLEAWNRLFRRAARGA